MSSTPQTIDDYLAPLSADKRAALEKLRREIQAAAPAAKECISYQMPGFRLNGKLLLSFAAWANHCALYAGTSIIKTFNNELEAFDIDKGTIRFSTDHPLPTALVKKIVKTRIANHADKQATKAVGAKRRR